MALIRIEKPDELRPSHVVMLALVTLALAGSCLLTSAGKPAMLPDGAVEWAPNSPLLAVVEILDLQYAQPTPNGVDIKGLVHGAAAGVGLLISMIGLVAWARAESVGSDTDVVQRADDGADVAPESLAKRQLNPVRTAQAMMLLYLAWSFASIAWSDAPQYARGGAVLLAIQAAWAFALAFGVNRRAAVYAGYALLAVLVATGLLAIAYQVQRNPTLRASYPIGNPLFLASCLLPGLTIGLAACVGGGVDVAHGARGRGLVKIVLCAFAFAVLAYATYLTRSRGPAVGLLVALMVMLLLAVGRRLRIVLGVAGVVGLIVLGGYLFSQRFATSATGRSESMRLRLYSWPYALELFQEEPFLGIGQAGYNLKADVFAISDVENDPVPLEYRIGDAHNEWLQVAADLGTVGVVLVLSALGLTVLAALRALPQMRRRGERVMTVGLIAALAGLVAAECFGVALRHEGLPIVYFTVIGLLWALAAPAPLSTLGLLARSRFAHIVGIVVALAACVVMVELSRRDFEAARAAYDLPAVLQAMELEEGERLANVAYANRLSPQRKLAGQRLLVSTRLQLAALFQEQFRRRMEVLNAGGGADPQVRAQADEYRRMCEAQLGLGEATLADMVAAAPSMFQAGSQALGFYELRGFFATVDGNAQAVADYQLAAAVALRNELARRPFEAELAAHYVIRDYERLEQAELFALLARPMRLQRPHALYLDVLRRTIADEGGPQGLFARFDALAALPAPAVRAEWSDPWAPELLRLGSLIAFTQGEFDRAGRYVSAALPYYEILGGEALLAHASALAERGDVQFSGAPEDVTLAIASAEEALKVAPQSEQGRRLCAQVALRLVTYHLAAGHEDFARKIIRDRVTGITDAELDMEIADRYVQLAFGVFERALARCPAKLNAWGQRALELAPEDSSPWFLAGELALRTNDAERIAESARAALRYHGDPHDVLAMLQRALTTLPADTRLQQMHDSLHQALVQQEQAQAVPAPLPPADPPADPAAGAGATEPALPTAVGTTGAPVTSNGN